MSGCTITTSNKKSLPHSQELRGNIVIITSHSYSSTQREDMCLFSHRGFWLPPHPSLAFLRALNPAVDHAIVILRSITQTVAGVLCCSFLKVYSLNWTHWSSWVSNAPRNPSTIALLGLKPLSTRRRHADTAPTNVLIKCTKCALQQFFRHENMSMLLLTTAMHQHMLLETRQPTGNEWEIIKIHKQCTHAPHFDHGSKCARKYHAVFSVYIWYNTTEQIPPIRRLCI